MPYALQFGPLASSKRAEDRNRVSERLVNAMLFENVRPDERQLVSRFTEFRGHASRSNGHGADSAEGHGNLPHDRVAALSFRQGDFSGLPLSDPVNGCIFRHIRHN
jgi:hypothetical protein